MSMTAVCPRQFLTHVRRILRRMFVVCSSNVRRISADHSPYFCCMSALYSPYVRRMSTIPNLSFSRLILSKPIFKLRCMPKYSNILNKTQFLGLLCSRSLRYNMMLANYCLCQKCKQQNRQLVHI